MGGRFLSLSHLTYDNSNLDKKTGSLSNYRLKRSKRDLDRLFDLLIKDFREKEPKYIIDTTASTLTDYQKDPLRNYPRIYWYLKEYYTLHTTINDVDIWEREDYFLEAASQ